MLAVKQWAKNRPPLVATLAIQLVSFSDDLYEALPQAKDRRLFGRQFPMPELSCWFSLYRSPRKSITAFGNLITGFHPLGSRLVEFALIARRLLKTLQRNPEYFKTAKPTPEGVKYWQDFMQDLHDHTLKDITDDLKELPLDPDGRTRMQQFIDAHEQELGFCFFIAVPCLLLHQTSPYILYKQAVSGDINAIEKLLKLDAAISYEPAIAQHILALKFSNKTNDYERLMAAPLKLAFTNYANIEEARRRSKYRLAGIIHSLSHALGYDMDYPTVGALFDAYSQDKGDDHDYDLPTGEPFRKSVINNSIP